MPPQDEYAKLALKYAPVFAQKVSRERRIADQIAPEDFAGSIKDVAKNPQRILDLSHSLDKKSEETHMIEPTIYYSVCETTTHYFLLYAAYHVLDWWKRLEPTNLYDAIRDALDEHVHDMEGALVVVTKWPSHLPDAVVTIAHLDFYLHTYPKIPVKVGESADAYPESLRIAKFNETVDGNIWLDSPTRRIKLYVESRGHGIYGSHKRWGGGEEIVYYYPDGEMKTPGTVDKDEKKTRTQRYKLEDICDLKGLWAHRFDTDVFRQNKEGRWAFVYIDEDGNPRGGAANPPWSWNDHNDNSPIGEIATDPARFIVRYAQGWGPVSTQYMHNPYQSI
jgi:hypothetical protein